MIKPIRLLNKVPNVDYFRYHKLCFALSVVLCVISIISISVRGLNYGVDFAGGILIEVRTPAAPDLAKMRSDVGALNLGDVVLQDFGGSNDVLIRIERQTGGEDAEMQAVQKVRDTLTKTLGAGVEYRRVEVVGPKVGGELVLDGILAVTLSLVGIMAYMGFASAGVPARPASSRSCMTA